MSKPVAGAPAPDFTAPVIAGNDVTACTITLSELRDKPVVLYFYPKDNTPGCTTQACDLRDNWTLLKKKAHVLGVSVDSLKAHEKFVKKYELPFPLISDEDHAIVDAYGVWVEKSLYGKKYMGTERSTFVIGTDGIIKAVLEKVKPAGHVQQVIAALDAST
ncbi:MAG: thioredoxin-dependent thiol peroxidase [Verrucomicrobium sp.]|nr:thioredoxin-dependent thiol peroxidase [Verrucomicrobium sp.]